MGGFEAVLLMACFIAAVWDFLYWEIPNEVTLFIIALFAIKLVVVGDFSHLLTPLLFALASLVIGFVLFFFKVLGPGDSKLIAACALWFAPTLFWQFLLAMAVFGGVLGIVYHLGFVYVNALRGACVRIIKSGFEKFPIVGVREIPEPPMRELAVIPYGVAIFFGALVACFIET